MQKFARLFLPAIAVLTCSAQTLTAQTMGTNPKPHFAALPLILQILQAVAAVARI